VRCHWKATAVTSGVHGLVDGSMQIDGVGNPLVKLDEDGNHRIITEL